MPNEDQDKRRERQEEWREERRQLEEAKLYKWTKTLTIAAACVVPLLGLVWCAVLCLWAENQETNTEIAASREKGLRYLAWAILGSVIWLIVWRLWGDEFVKFTMIKPFF